MTEPMLNRLQGLDLARYLAFVGMVIVNFKIVMGAESGEGFLNWMTSAIEGRAAATFVVLAGIGLGLAHLKKGSGMIPVTIRRALFLLVVGLLNMTVFEADIIHYYAFYFLFGAFLFGLGSRALLGIVIGLNLIFLGMVLSLDYDAGWNWNDYSYFGFWTPVGFVRNLFFNGWHPVAPWLGFLLFGVMLSRISLTERKTQLRLIVGGGLALASAEGVSALLSTWVAEVDVTLLPLVATDPVPPAPLYMLAGTGAACLVLGVCMMIASVPRLHRNLRLVVPAGRQTLTLYIAHILIGMGTLEALGMLGGQTVAAALIAALVFCGVATIYALIWANWFRRGPVEALMRKVAG